MRSSRKGFLAYRESTFAGRLGIRNKILIYLAILVGFMLSLIWLFQSALLYNIYRGSRASQLQRTADLILQNIDHEELDSLADRLGEENDLAVMLLDGDGNPLFSAGRTSYTPLEDLSDEQIRAWAARSPADGKALLETVDKDDTLTAENTTFFSGYTPDSRSLRAQGMVYLRQVSFADGARGTLLLYARMTPIASTLDIARRQFIVITAALVIAAVLVGATMASSVSEPIIETNRAARELSRSRYTRPAHSGGYREIAELNDTLVRAAEDLRRVEDLQRELIANISHDLRTPLTMIQGYAEAMRDLPEEMNPENMQIIIDETNRLSSMVNEVLDFSRLRTGNLELKKTSFSLTSLIREICDRISAMTGVEGYTVLFDPAEDFTVTADSGRISQVIYNLIGNALTYTGADKTVRVTQERRGNAVRVQVSDTGEGIPADELPYLWDRYYRSRENHRRAVIGSGLGLNICRGILEKHDAPYGVESEPGLGTTFWFELPLNP